MYQFPVKTRHFTDVTSFVAQTWQDVSDKSLEKRAMSLMFLQRFMDKTPQNPKLISSAHGKIKKILFTIPSYVFEGDSNPLWSVYSDLFLKLPEHTEICLMIQSVSVEFMKGWAEEKGLSSRIKYIVIPDYLNITIWAEDAYVIVQDQKTKERFFLEPHSFPRWEDGFIANYASKELNYNRTIIPLYFEGGNILIGDDFFLMGADYPVNTLQYIRELDSDQVKNATAEHITELYKRFMDCERELIFVGSTLPVPSRDESSFYIKDDKWREFYYKKNEIGTVQPIFHIDMFISLAGRNAEGKYQILVGDPRIAADLLNIQVIPYTMVELFDNIAENLERIGFEVTRNPLPLIYLDDTAYKERSWYFASGNNVMTEIIDEGNKTVWLPTYGHGNWKELEKTDQKNKEIWESLGFKVILLGDFHPFAENCGSLHCIKKYLERE